MPRRVTFLTDIPTPYMLAVLSALAARCELTAIFCSESGTRAMEWEMATEHPFRHEIVGGLVLRRPNPDATDFYPDPRILAAIARSRPDAIISAGFSFPSLYAAAYRAVSRARLIVHSDGTARSEAAFGAGQMFTRRLLSRWSDAAAGNSEPAVERFVELGWPRERVFRAPHSTQVEPLHAVARERAYRNGPALEVLHVGRLIPRKGVDRLVAAAAAAREQGADVRLSIVGTGPEEAALRAQAERLALPVRWHGFVDQPGLPAVYAAADVFDFPTLEDPFGIVALEAAASGLPLVASPHGGATQDLVRDGETGFVVDPDDVAAHAAALVTLARDPELRERMGRAAYELTRERTPEATAAGYMTAVEAVLA